jgi:hypothetical protein
MSRFRVFSLSRKTAKIVKGIVQGDIGLDMSVRDMYSESRSQDEKSGFSNSLVKPKKLRGNSKPSRPVSSGQTSKPFWSNGKPKCKKGFRYDFKRKLCVKTK